MRYADGYESFSPQKPFEDGYSLLPNPADPQPTTGYATAAGLGYNHDEAQLQHLRTECLRMALYVSGTGALDRAKEYMNFIRPLATQCPKSIPVSWIERVAKVCHEANRAYCETIGDFSQLPWDEAEEWQRQSAIKGVEFALNNPLAPASAQHDAWLADKEKDGWKYGPVKLPEKKEHPYCVPYSKLPMEQRLKDSLFKGIVAGLHE